MLDTDDWKFIIGFLMTITIILVVIGGLIAGIGVILEYFGCQDLQGATEEFNFQWTFWTGCRVQLENGFWISVSDYKYIYGDINLLEVR